LGGRSIPFFHLHIFEKGIGCSKERSFGRWRTATDKKLCDAQLSTLAAKGITPEIKGIYILRREKNSAKLKLDGEFKATFDFAQKAKRQVAI
jgi:hypothetical protein